MNVMYNHVSSIAYDCLEGDGFHHACGYYSEGGNYLECGFLI